MAQVARQGFLTAPMGLSGKLPDLTLSSDQTMDNQAAADPYRLTLRHLRPGVVVAAAISAVISVLMLTGSLYMLQVYDRVLSSGSVPTLLGLFAIVVVLYCFLGFYDFLRSRMLSRLALQLDGRLGPQAFRRWIEGAQKGQPLRDLDMLRGFLAGPVLSGLFDLPWVPLYLAVLFMVHPWLGWLTIGGAAVVATLAWVGHRLSKAALQRSLSGDSLARDFAERSQRNAEMILAMGMQTRVGAQWRDLQDAALVKSQQAGDPGDMIGAISRAFRMLMQSGILTLGAYLVIQGQMSGGMIIASSILTGRALGPIDQVIAQWRSIAKAVEAHHRLKTYFAVPHRQHTVMALPAPSGQISLSHVVKYAPDRAGITLVDRTRLLDDISFDLSPGDGLGVIGASASGKSTLARLLVGALGADAGEIRLDGATRDQWDSAVLGRHMGYLPQQVDLLPGTLRDNIARFDPSITDAEVMAAARMVGIHDMILHLADGYAARVGVLGEVVNLSGGQVQRIGLARAVCGGPRLVGLDEPNSNLDSTGETCLTSAISALRAAGSVVVVMAHRPNVLLATNKLLILDGGRLVQFGLRDDLIAPAAHRSQSVSVAPIAPSPMTEPAVTPSSGAPRSRPPGASADMMRRARLLSQTGRSAAQRTH